MEQIDGCHVTCIYELLVNWILDLSYWRTTAGVRGKLLHTYGWVYQCNSDDSCSLLVGTLARVDCIYPSISPQKDEIDASGPEYSTLDIGYKRR